MDFKALAFRRPSLPRSLVYRRSRARGAASAAPRLALLVLGVWLVAACGATGGGVSAPGLAAEATPGIGDAARGKALFSSKGCQGCHRISGEIAGGMNGPDLKGLPSRPTIAGAVPNTPENLWHFIENPQRSKPGTRMPRPALSGPELDDLVAYLQTLP